MTTTISRRSFLGSIAAGSALVTAGGTAAGIPSRRFVLSGHWRQHGFDAANTARTRARGPQSNPTTRWLSRVPSGDSAALVAGRVVLVLSVTGSGTSVHGLHRSSGRPRWSVPIGDLVVSGAIAADGDRVFVPEIGRPQVSALSLSAGEAEWRTDVSEVTEDAAHPRLGVSGGFSTGPAVHDGTLYLGLRAAGGIAALDTESGDLETAVPGPYTHFAVGDGSVCAARGSPSDDEHGLVFHDADTGERYREYATEGRPGRPTIGEELVFVGTSENRVHAVDRGGETAWTAETGDWAVSLALAGGVVLARTEESILALDADTGEPLWGVESGEARPVVANDVVYVSREKGFDAYHAEAGERVTRYRNPDVDGTIHYLSIVNNTLLATTPRGSVLAVSETLGPM